MKGTKGGNAMKTASYAVFQENRAKFPLEELRKYDGQWVAFSADGTRIVANGGRIADLVEPVRAAGEDMQDVALEHIVFDSDEIYLGAAELS
jgi:hypothetical protein